jgi:hypothetical protein
VRGKILLVAAFVVPIGAVAPSPSEAGPWALGQGHVYAKLSYQRLRAERYAQPDGTVFDIPTFSTDNLDLYVAAGLTDALTLTLGVPLVRSSDLADQPDELGPESGFGDLQMGLEAEIARRGRFVFGLRGVVQAPTGDETVSDGLQAQGSGVWEGAGLLTVGTSLGGGRGWAQAEAGYQYRGGGLKDGFQYGLQIGWNANGRTWLSLNLRGVEPWSHEPGDVPAGSLTGVGDRTTYAVVGPSFFVRLGAGFGLQLDLEGAVRARNLAKGPQFRAGLTYAR